MSTVSHDDLKSPFILFSSSMLLQRQKWTRAFLDPFATVLRWSWFTITLYEKSLCRHRCIIFIKKRYRCSISLSCIMTTKVFLFYLLPLCYYNKKVDYYSSKKKSGLLLFEIHLPLFFIS